MREGAAHMDVLTRNNNGVFTIELNRPDKKNALTAAMYQTLTEALQQAQADTTVRAILIHGKPEAFTAGNDLDDFAQRPPTSEDTPVFRFLHALCGVEKPLVAAVQGVPIGIGT